MLLHSLQVLALLQQLTALPSKSQMRDACTALLAHPVAADIATQLSAALQQLDLAGGMREATFLGVLNACLNRWTHYLLTVHDVGTDACAAVNSPAAADLAGGGIGQPGFLRLWDDCLMWRDRCVLAVWVSGTLAAVAALQQPDLAGGTGQVAVLSCMDAWFVCLFVHALAVPAWRQLHHSR
jgi:hypothetical protein